MYSWHPSIPKVLHIASMVLYIYPCFDFGQLSIHRSLGMYVFLFMPGNVEGKPSISNWTLLSRI